MRRILPAILGLVLGLSTTSAVASVPDTLQITCDVDRTAFRKLAATPSSVTFRLWDAVSGGSQCGADHVVLMEKVLALRPKGDKFDGQRPRKFLELRAVIGTDGDSGTPVQLCAGNETWVDVQVGSTTLTCEFSADPNSKQGVAPDAPARRRLQTVAFAQECERCLTIDPPFVPASPCVAGERLNWNGSAFVCEPIPDISARVSRSTNFSTNSSAGDTIDFDTERWDTTSTIFDPAMPTRLRAPEAGKYLIFGHVSWEANSAGARSVGIKLNGSTSLLAVVGMPGSAINSANDQNVSTHYHLNMGDYVELEVFQNSGTGLEVRADPNFSPEFGMVKLP